MAQQTAVEWFEKNYHELLVEASINNMHVVLFDKKRGELFQQAKEMEKEQMLKTYLSACDRLTPYGYYGDSAEQYYNETFNK